MKRKYTERRLYYFICAKCGHQAVSFKRKRVKAELCGNCRRFAVPENQMSLI